MLLNPDEIDTIRHQHRVVIDKILFAENRTATLADEFTRLEVQIAAILLAFIGLLIQETISGSFSPPAHIAGFVGGLYTFSVFSLVISLASGLIHLKRKEYFWDVAHVGRVEMRYILEKVLEGKMEPKDARLMLKGLASCKEKIMRSPRWSWIIQTVTLIIGGIPLLVLLFVLVFFT